MANNKKEKKLNLTLVDILKEHAVQDPDFLLYSFHNNNSETTLTTKSLDTQANRVALHISQHTISQDRAILLYPPGLDFITALFGCFYANITAVPIYSYNFQWTKLVNRLEAVIKDTQAKIILTTKEILKDKQRLIDLAPWLENITFIATDEIAADTKNSTGQIPSTIDPEAIAFLQYSSGSTGTPKGVMVSHKNLVSNLDIIRESFGFTPGESVVSWLPVYHDMGLIGNVLGAVYSHTTLYLFSPFDFIRKPLRWLQLISKTRTRVSGGPNFAYDLCNRYVTPEQCEGLDLSCWDVAYNGAEMVRDKTLKEFVEKFSPYGFKATAHHPCYGLAEATLMVTNSDILVHPPTKILDRKLLLEAKIKEAPDAASSSNCTLVSSGRLQKGQHVEIVNPDTKKRCAANEIGEIWVSGDSICGGYWNRPDETKHTFSATLEDESSDNRFLRTGDMGFLDKGWLYVTGRIKDLIIMHGQNHYPEDIESTVMESHPLLKHRRSVAFSHEIDGQESLVVLVPLPEDFNQNGPDIIEAIRKKVSEHHELVIKELLFVKRGSIPTTSSGKVQRRECKNRFDTHSLEILHRASSISQNSNMKETKKTESNHKNSLCKLPTDARFVIVLNHLQKFLSNELRQPLEQINIIEPLNAMGLDSLSKVRMQHEIQELSGVVIGPERINDDVTLIQLAREIADETIENTETVVLSLEEQKEYPLSEGQKSLFFLNKLISEKSAYNISRAAKVMSQLNIKALEKAFKHLVKRHPSLRTRFFEENNQLLQSALDDVNHEIEIINSNDWTESQLHGAIKNAASRPFDLNSGAPIRLSVFQRENQPIILFSVHHIVADLWSLTILLNELCEFYSAEITTKQAVLPTIAAKPLDYIHHEERFLASKKAAQMRQHWLAELSGQVDPLDLPIDHPRPGVKTYRGSTASFSLSPDLTQRIKSFALKNNLTPYVVLLAAYTTLLHRYTTKSHITVGSPMANRTHTQFANLISYLVNPVAIRTIFSDEMTLKDVILQVKEKTLSAISNQEYPLSKIIEDLNIKRDSSNTPLFQTMFSYLNPMLGNDLAAFALGQAGSVLEHKQLALEPYAIKSDGAQFDLNVAIALMNDTIGSTWEYSTDLFEEETIIRMERHYEAILNQMVNNPGQRINEFKFLSEDEIKKITLEWNHTETNYDPVQPLHQLFEKQVEKTPDLIAVLDQNESLSYKDLNIRVNQLAHHLRNLGVGPNVTVAILMNRSIEMVIAIYAIHKAGGAYLPIDPNYPQQHLAWVIDDANPKVILTQEDKLASITDSSRTIVLLKSFGVGFSDKPVMNPNVKINPTDLAYIIYTSGSTGKPKGVMIPHGGIYNRIMWMQEAYQLNTSDRVLQKTPYTFDVSVWEFLWPLTVGASLYICKPEGHKDPDYLVETIIKNQVTTLHFVPSMLKPFLENKEVSQCHSLKRIFCSGEALHADVAKLCLQKLNTELHNLYGPTEASVDVSFWQCPRDEEFGNVPIGRPIANTQLYILDDQMQPVAIGVHGELYIGGKGLAKGYLNRPELTAERFVKNPFSIEPTEKLYKTGDLCRFLSDGTIEFLGRKDNQVKIRGFRIELEEVEIATCTHPKIKAAVATAIKDKSGNPQLAVYVVSPATDRPLANELRRHLCKYLPEYMIPSVFIALDHLPLLASGKIDRKALPEAKFIRENADANYKAPETSIEKIICSIYEDILDVKPIGIQDNFFDLGGDSILVLRAAGKMREQGVNVTIQQLYSSESIEEVASKVESDSLAESPLPKLAPFSLISASDLDKLPTELEDAYPLSKMQEGLVFHSEFSPDYETYVMGMHVALNLNPDCVHTALSMLTKRHPLLRTSFDLLHFDEPLQFVHPKVSVPVTFFDIEHLPHAQQEKEVERFMREEKWRKFDWTQAPFLRVSIHKRGSSSNQFTFCHPLFDGWSMGLLITEFFTLYGALLKDQIPHLHPLPVLTYRDFVAFERKIMKAETSLQFWRESLAGVERSELPRWPNHRKQAAGTHVRMTVKVKSETLRGLQQLATVAEVPFKSVLLAAHLRVVGLLTGSTDVTTGVLANGRPEQVDGDKIIGMFLNTVPFRVNLLGKTWLDLVKETFITERKMLPHRSFPLAELVRTLGEGNAFFETAFNYIHFHIYKTLENVPDLSVLGWKSPSDQTYFPLTAYFHLDISSDSSELLFFLDVDTGILDQKQIDALSHYYLNTLNAMASDFYAEYKSISLLPLNERQLLTDEWNKTLDTKLYSDLFVHQRFSASANQYGNNVAVTFNDQSLSYCELDKYSNQLAHYLRERGVGPNLLVGVHLERSHNLIIALLGILKAGGAYVPLDPSYPQQRLDYMLNDSQASIVITQSSLKEKLSAGSFKTICIDSDWSSINECSDVDPRVQIEEEDLAYVIYTSGSTGQPKGVEIPHRALGNFISSIKKLITMTSNDVMLAVTTIAFDIAGLELYMPLTTGAQIILAPREMSIDGEKLADVLNTAGVTFMQATPATWRMLISAGWTGSTHLNALCGGERMPADLANDLLERSASLWNLYGPTETTIWSTACRIETVDDIIPIGRPISNTRIYILDSFGQQAPIGVAGELYIAGLGVALGYRNRPDLTAERFLTDPFSQEKGSMMYRTGDLCRFRPDGVLEYLNRVDHQVKVRGFRIELGEIETQLNQIPGIEKAIMKIWEDGFGENRIAAYISTDASRTFTSIELRQILEDKLPTYMIPSTFVFLKEFPLTLNGKIDHKALPKPDDLRPELSENYVAPRNDLEIKIATIYAEMLRVSQVGIDDNFFDLGGHSLLLVRIHGRLQELLSCKIPIVKLFEFPTIRKVAAFLDDQNEKLGLDTSNERANTRNDWVLKQQRRRQITDKVSA